MQGDSVMFLRSSKTKLPSGLCACLESLKMNNQSSSSEESLRKLWTKDLDLIASELRTPSPNFETEADEEADADETGAEVAPTLNFFAGIVSSSGE